VTRMGYMFYWVYAFNQDLSSWNVSGVTECNGFSEGSTTVYTKPKPNFTNCNPN
jgi:surface protein